MADSFKTLAELVVLNDKNLADFEATDLLDDAPLLKALAADIASNGTSHKYIKETGAPNVGFRNVNEGRENSKSGETLVTADLKVLDASFDVDKAIANSYHRGAESFLAREARKHIKAAFFAAEQQFINGTGVDAGGFAGLANATTLDALADAMVIGAGGTTADTGSSVYLIRTNGDGGDCMAVVGQDGMIEIGESYNSTVQVDTDTNGNGGRFSSYRTDILGWLGLQYGSAKSVARIANLTADSGKGLTDALIYDALAEFPASRMPNLIVMNRRSQKQIRASRTATNATGAPAPFINDIEGIPVIVTDGITSTEALLS